MQAFVRFFRCRGSRGALACTVLAALVAGCATAQRPSASGQTTQAPDVRSTQGQTASGGASGGAVAVARSGRYTLVELVPEPAQRDLLRQTVEVSIAPTLDATVGDAMRHVLRRTGYRLCDGGDSRDAANAGRDSDASAVADLYTLPLPAAHLRLGPLPLRDVLLTLAGPAWELLVDDAARRVCFRRKTGSPSATPQALTDSAALNPKRAEGAQTVEAQPANPERANGAQTGKTQPADRKQAEDVQTGEGQATNLKRANEATQAMEVQR